MPLSHCDLLQNPALLLKNGASSNAADFNQELGNSSYLFFIHCLFIYYADAVLLAGVLNDNYSIITTSCCSFIPAPALDGPVVECVDFFFGHHDYLVWPQSYNPKLPHLPLIGRRELDISDPSRSILWALPDRRDFQLRHEDACVGLGMLSERKTSQLRAFYRSLIDQCRAEDCLAHSSRTKPLWDILYGISPLFVRLEQLAMGFRTMCRTVRAVQRDLLEAEAYIKYLILTYGSPTTFARFTSTYSATVGVFVSNIEDLQRFQQMRIIHWLIRPYEKCHHCMIKEVTTLQQPSELGISTEHFPLAAPIFSGRTSDPAKYMAIRACSRNCIRFPDPFHSRIVPLPLPSSGLLRSGLLWCQERALTSRQRQFKGSSDRW